LDGVIYNGSFRFDALTGKTIFAPKRDGVPVNEGPSTIIAGDQIVGIWEMRAGTQDLAGGQVRSSNLLDDRSTSDDAWAARFAWVFWGNKHYGTPSAQANRLFWRSQGYLWCIGDPTQKFPTPRNCPSEAKVML
jgi:hypothetical protein